MPISEKNRRRFEGIGFEAVRRELTAGYSRYLPIDATSQAEAKEWVAEKEKEIGETDSARTNREKRSLRYALLDLACGHCRRDRRCHWRRCDVAPLNALGEPSLLAVGGQLRQAAGSSVAATVAPLGGHNPRGR